jgi:hypothetical protein
MLRTFANLANHIENGCSGDGNVVYGARQVDAGPSAGGGGQSDGRQVSAKGQRAILSQVGALAVVAIQEKMKPRIRA